MLFKGQNTKNATKTPVHYPPTGRHKVVDFPEIFFMILLVFVPKMWDCGLNKPFSCLLYS